MLYMLKCQPKVDSDQAAGFTRSFFAQSDKKIRRDQALKLLNQITGGNFLEGTVEIEELPGFDPEEVRSEGTTLFIL